MVGITNSMKKPFNPRMALLIFFQLAIPVVLIYGIYNVIMKLQKDKEQFGSYGLII